MPGRVCASFCAGSTPNENFRHNDPRRRLSAQGGRRAPHGVEPGCNRYGRKTLGNTRKGASFAKRSGVWTLVTGSPDVIGKGAHAGGQPLVRGRKTARPRPLRQNSGWDDLAHVRPLYRLITAPGSAGRFIEGPSGRPMTRSCTGLNRPAAFQVATELPQLLIANPSFRLLLISRIKLAAKAAKRRLHYGRSHGQPLATVPSGSPSSFPA